MIVVKLFDKSITSPLLFDKFGFELNVMSAIDKH